MKKIFGSTSVLVVLMIVLSLCEPNDFVRLEVVIEDCRDSDAAYLDKLVLLRDGKKIKTFEPKWDTEFTIDSLQPGEYEFRYTSMFDLPVSVKVDAAQPGKYPVTLCSNYIDYSAETYKPIIDRIQPGRAYTVFFSTMGCFHSYTDTMTFLRTDSNYVAKFEGKSKILDSTDLVAVRHFELELNHVNNGGCTTTESYSIVYGGRTLKKAEDGSCDWWGWRYLLLSLGFEKQ